MTDTTQDQAADESAEGGYTRRVDLRLRLVRRRGAGRGLLEIQESGRFVGRHGRRHEDGRPSRDHEAA